MGNVACYITMSPLTNENLHYAKVSEITKPKFKHVVPLHVVGSCVQITWRPHYTCSSQRVSSESDYWTTAIQTNEPGKEGGTNDGTGRPQGSFITYGY
jgi:hypothetical protein